MTDRISGLVRQGDLVARLGGDEFAILTGDQPDLHSSRAMAERLVRDLRVPYVIGEHTITVSASIGIASARDAGADAQELVRNADVAMYMAKANGKSGFAVFDPGMHASIRARHELGNDLQHAVDLGQLRLVYQPIVSLETGRVAGLEALVRWQHPDRGLVVPGEFIEIAEENGSILPIGRWVLREACERAVAWQADGVIGPGLFVCVNVSAREIQQPGFVGAVEEALAWAGLEPSRLILEITETALIKATTLTVSTMDALRALGVRVVIDDFGTGYFSLSHLRQFPVDALKIASEFIQVANDDSRSAALAGAIVALGDVARHRHRGRGHRIEGAGGADARAGVQLRPGLLLRQADDVGRDRGWGRGAGHAAGMGAGRPTDAVASPSQPAIGPGRSAERGLTLAIG